MSFIGAVVLYNSQIISYMNIIKFFREYFRKLSVQKSEVRRYVCGKPCVEQFPEQICLVNIAPTYC